jgi:uncharacterized protein YjbI with pentapeptide repeats
MSTEDSGKDSLSMVITGATTPEEINHYFTSRSDLTYRKIYSLSISDIDMHQSLLTGSLIRDCVFTKVVFARSDLDGLRAERSVFIECDFSNCDIRSSIFARCEFKSCLFTTSLIDDCEFEECRFTDCSFKNALLSHNRFHSSSLATCNLSPGSFLHNKLYRSELSDMILGDCTLLYVILRECTLTRVSINAESVGAIFGLTREQLSQANFVYLGNVQSIPPNTDVINLVSEEYRRRKWAIGQLVLAVNFNLASTLSAFDDYLSMSFKMFTELGFAKGDELDFLGDLLQELASLERLPLLVALKVLEWCTNLELAIRQDNKDLPDSSGGALLILASRVSLLANTLLDKLNESFGGLELEENDRILCIKALFNERPALSLTDLLNSISLASTLNITQKSQLIRAENGSYVEIVYTTLFTLLGLKVFLFLVNGCLVQLTEMKHRVRVLARRNAPKSYMDLVLSPSQQASPLVMSLLPGLAKYISELSWLKTSSLSGYSASNIQSLQEVRCENPQDTPSINQPDS